WSGQSRPAMMRNSVVLPEPDGPSRATSSPERISRSTWSRAVKAPKRRLTSCSVIFMDSLLHRAGLERDFGDQRDQREQRQQRGHRERGRELIFVVEHFDMQRHG